MAARSSTPGPRPTAVDLFCGCGGISWGLRGGGFEVLAGVDIDPPALETFARNFGSDAAVHHDLAGDGARGLRERLGLGHGELDLLAGGPPCQGFSKNVPRSGRFLDDPKNLLVRSFMQAVDEFRPKVVLLENVAEMANAFEGAFRRELLRFFSERGYQASYEVHNAAEHGVPQRRRRVVFVASRTGQPVGLPAAACSLPNRSGTHKNPDRPPGTVGVWEAIGDLAAVRGPAARPDEYSCDPFTDYQRRMRRERAALTDHRERPLAAKQQARYDALGPGEGLRDLPLELQTKGGYSGAYGRLTRQMVAPTITRWVFHPGSGRFGHPVEPRLLTIREAARLQSFSDDFEFAGTNHNKSWQIGNAVPPLLVERFAPALVAAAEGLPPPRGSGRSEGQLDLLEYASRTA